MESITAFHDRADPDCERCEGDALVCEAHPDRPWNDGEDCCGAPGMPCACTEVA